MKNISDTGRTAEAIRTIMDIFSGADGGLGFANFCAFMQDMGERANNGDQASVETENVVIRFARLLDIATGKRGL